jgi:hypothetical protein
VVEHRYHGRSTLCGTDRRPFRAETVAVRLAIRGAIVNHRTEAVDVDRLVDAVLAAGRALFGIAPVAM